MYGSKSWVRRAIASAVCIASLLGGVSVLGHASPVAAARRFSDREIITDLTRLHVYKQTGISQSSLSVRVDVIRSGYARARVSAPGIDTARVYLKKQGSAWKVIAGPGTSFSSRELARLGVPRGVR